MLDFSILSAADEAEAAKTGNNIYAPEIQEIVKRVVASIIASGGIPSHMEDDAAIDLYMELYRAADKFDPSKCDFVNYSRMVVSRYAAYIVRKYRERNRLPLTSIDATIDAKGHTLADVLMGDHEAEDTKARHVENVLRLMPEDLRNLCYQIMEEGSIREVARKRGLSFSWFYQKYMPRIRHSYNVSERKLRKMEETC